MQNLFTQLPVPVSDDKNVSLSLCREGTFHIEIYFLLPGRMGRRNRTRKFFQKKEGLRVSFIHQLFIIYLFIY